MTRWVNVAGILLVVLSLAFVVDRLWVSELWHTAAQILPQTSWALIGGACLYALSGFLLATAWHGLMRGAMQPSVALPWSRAVAIYGRTQLAKYIPGNVFHLVGRHAYGLRAGLGHAPQAMAAVMEIVLTILAAASVSLLGWSLPLADTRQGVFQTVTLVLAVVAVLLAAKLLAARFNRPSHSRLAVLQQAVRMPWQRLGQAYALYLGFFVVSGAILAVLLWRVSELPWPAYGGRDWLTFVAVAAFAWLAGFVTPGASAGIGVREAVLILLLGPQLGEAPATLAAVGFRFVTIAGDLGFFVCALAVRARTSAPLPNN
jgi:hypothetical protein